MFPTTRLLYITIKGARTLFAGPDLSISPRVELLHTLRDWQKECCRSNWGSALRMAYYAIKYFKSYLSSFPTWLTLDENHSFLQRIISSTYYTYYNYSESTHRPENSSRLLQLKSLRKALNTGRKCRKYSRRCCEIAFSAFSICITEGSDRIINVTAPVKGGVVKHLVCDNNFYSLCIAKWSL